MLFNSQSFLLVFLPFALIVHGATAPRRQVWVAATIGLSLIFYAAWDVRLLPLLLCSILLNWGVARLYESTRSRALLISGIIVNLLVLAIFKYTNFVLANLSLLLGRPLGALAIALPLGIS